MHETNGSRRWQPGGTRQWLTSRLLRSAASDAMPEGTYDPVDNARYVELGVDHGAAVAGMVSWHEGFHAFLNASTTFGNTMLLAGVLARAGHPEFEPFVVRMIDHALVTHETYATVAALRAVSRGAVSPALLAGYPDYQPYLDRFLTLFGPTRPRLSTMVLSSCARVAMQTDVYERIRDLPCDRWPSVEFPASMQPDVRFASLLNQVNVSAAMNAVERAIADGRGPLAPLVGADLSADEENEIFDTADADEQAVVNAVAFDAFARALTDLGCAPPRYDQQKEGLPALIDKVQRFGGAALDTTFHVPTSLTEDYEAVFKDFRRELLVVRDSPIPALFLDWRTDGEAVGNAFVFSSTSGSYLQLVAMPTAKARHLYREIPASRGTLARWDESVVTGYRRYRSNGGTESWVDFLVTDSPTADRIAERHRDSEVLCVVSLCALRDPEWQAKWLSSGGPVTEVLVLIDDDPFELLDEFAGRSGEIQLALLSAQLGTDAPARRVECLCMAEDGNPDILYLTPISVPFRQSVVEIALRRVAGARVDRALIDRWSPSLARAIPHLIREEGTFGVRFW